MSVLRTLLASAFLLVVGGGVINRATDGFRAFTTESARRLVVRDHPPVVPTLPLQTAEGGRTSFSGAEFAHLERELAAPIAAGKLAMLSVSFDPQRDTPAALSEYVRSHKGGGAGWIAARPVSEANLAEFKRVFGVVVIPDGMGGFMHNAATLVVDPTGKLVRVFDWDDVSGAARYVTQRLTP